MLRKLLAITLAATLSFSGGAAYAGLNQVPGPIYGSQTGTVAVAGFVGYLVTNTTSGTSLSNVSNANLTSLINLPAGVWDISGVCQFVAASTTATSAIQCGISTASTVFGGLGTFSNIQTTFATTASNAIVAPTQRVILAAATTVYLVGVSAFSVSTMTANGFIRATLVN